MCARCNTLSEIAGSCLKVMKSLDQEAFSLLLFYGPRIKHSSLEKVHGDMNRKRLTENL